MTSKRTPNTASQTSFVRAEVWESPTGVISKDDEVTVLDPNGDPLKGTWVFKAIVTNTDNGKVDVEVVGGKKGHVLTRAFKPERVERK